MVETKYINRKSFTATNMVRSAATITVLVFLVFCLSAARGENLTTLDGRTFTNVYSVTNYSSVVVIRHDGGMTGVKPSNLPQEFCDKYSITKPVSIDATKPAPEIAIQKKSLSVKSVKITPELDDYLSNHASSDLLFETNAQCGCSVFLRSKQFTLDVFNSDLYTGSLSEVVAGPASYDRLQAINTRSLNDGSRMVETFQYGQEIALNQVFNKFLEWDETASKKNVESFRKEIPHDLAGHIFIFCWDSGSKESTLSLTTNTAARFRKDQVIMLQNILKDFPEFKEQLVKIVERQEAQKGLFK